MNLFLDTQYTSMLWPELISLALVAENGDHVYVELDDWDERFCAAFIVKTVLPLRTGPRLSREAARKEVSAFIERFDNPTIWTDEPHHDPVPLYRLVGDDVPYSIKPIGATQLTTGTWDIMDLNDYRRLLEAEFAQGGGCRHHALDDAKAAAATWFAVRHMTVRRRL